MKNYQFTVTATSRKVVNIRANDEYTAGILMDNMIMDTDALDFSQKDVESIMVVDSETKDMDGFECEEYCDGECCDGCIFYCEKCGNCLVYDGGLYSGEDHETCKWRYRECAVCGCPE